MIIANGDPMTQADVKELVNEICLHCEKYREEHRGACSGCPGLKVKWGEQDES